MIENLNIDGIKTPVLAAGPRTETEAVVFLHGNPGSGDDWRELLDQVGPFARCIAPDMPGYGKAGRSKAFNYTVDGYAQHLGKILTRLGIERVHLVLHDFGGAWGVAWAAKHPKKVASLSFMDTGWMPGYRWHKYARIWQKPVIGELFQLFSFKSILKFALNGDNPKPLPEWFLDRVYEHADWGNKVAVLKLYRASLDIHGMTAPFGRILKPYAIPGVVIWGKDDLYLPSRYAHSQGEYLDVEGVHVLEHCGHWPMIDEPDQVSQILVPFLNKHYKTKRLKAA